MKRRGSLELRTLDTSELGTLDLRSPEVDLRRDLYRFVRYVEERGHPGGGQAKPLVRTRRQNLIPKTHARRLARLLSYSGEAEAVASRWTERISEVARALGLVSYDTEGTYMGYTSTEPSFPDNEIRVDRAAWRAFLAQSPRDKETKLLDVLLRTTRSEFFYPATLFPGEEVFTTWGSRTGPISRTDLSAVRRHLLELLSSLEAGVWYQLPSLVEHLGKQAPHLIFDPRARKPSAVAHRLRYKGKTPPPEITLEDLYTGFHERKPGQWDHGQRVKSQSRRAFQRVEGRYLEFFLREIPYLCGFVELGYRPADDPHGLDVVPPLERLRGFRLAPRFFQLLGGDPAFDEVRLKVLPSFEVLLEAASWPEVLLEEDLAPFCSVIAEERPLVRLRLEKKKVIAATAQAPERKAPAELLRGLGAHLPGNVAAELAGWSRRGEKVVFYQGCGLLEIAEGAPESRRKEVLAALGELAEGDPPHGLPRRGINETQFVVVRQPDRAFERLEQAHLVPQRLEHREAAFVSCGGRLAAPDAPRRDAKKDRAATKVRLERLDLVGLRASDPALLAALEEALRGKAPVCALAGDGLLAISASALPALRAALRRLADRFEITEAADDGR